MARTRYFCDLGPGPEPVPLQGGLPMAKPEFAQRFPGVAGLRADGYSLWVGYPLEGPGGLLPVTRRIDYKAQPSRHDCNAKCLHGKATGTCECQCGGSNHGRGVLSRLVSPPAQQSASGATAHRDVARPIAQAGAMKNQLFMQNLGLRLDAATDLAMEPRHD